MEPIKISKREKLRRKCEQIAMSSGQLTEKEAIAVLVDLQRRNRKLIRKASRRRQRRV